MGACQSPARRLRDFLRCSPVNQTEGSEGPSNPRSSSSARRSEYFWKRLKKLEAPELNIEKTVIAKTPTVGRSLSRPEGKYRASR